MNPVDPRTRSKVVLEASRAKSYVSLVIPRRLLLTTRRAPRYTPTDLVWPGVLFMSALALGKSIVDDTNLFAVAAGVSVCGAVGSLVWTVNRGKWSTQRPVEVCPSSILLCRELTAYQWSVVGFSSLMLSLRLTALLVALVRLPPARYSFCIPTRLFTL